MNDVLIYLIKVNVAIVLFYLIYRVICFNDTLLIMRRIYLLASLFAAIIYPFISVGHIVFKQLTVQPLLPHQAVLPELIVTASSEKAISTGDLMFMGYLLIAVLLSVRIIVQLVSIIRWRIKGSLTYIGSTSVIALTSNIAPFSFFNYIFINPILHTEEETLQILAHEKTHVRQWHSLDVVIAEISCCACWINPAIWLLRREIRQNLEFLADNKVLQSGFEAKSYQYHLLQLSYQVPKNELANNFNISPLKKRIMKMNQQKTAKVGLLKYSLLVPMIITLVVIVNAQQPVSKATVSFKKVEKINPTVTESKPEALVSETKPSISQEVTNQETPSQTANIEEDQNEKKIYQVVDKMPEFPGGTSQLMTFLSRNIRYPVAAQETKTQGKIIVQFVVDEAGQIGEIQVLRSNVSKGKTLNEIVVVGYGPSTTDKTTPAIEALEKEAIRVVKSMPAWTPGEQAGEKVAVYYTLPIVFKLQ